MTSIQAKVWISGLLLMLSLTVLAGQPLSLSKLQDRQPLWELSGRVDWQNSEVGEVSGLDSTRWQGLDSLSLVSPPLYSWLRLNILNDQERPVYVDFNMSRADSISFFVSSPDTSFSLVTGPYVSSRKWLHNENASIVSLLCEPGVEYQVFFRLWGAPQRPFSVQHCFVQPRLQTMTDTVNRYRRSIGRTEFNGFFLGAIGITFFFALIVFLRTRGIEFLYYSLYLFGISLYAIIVKTLPYSPLAKTAYLNYQLSYQLGEPVQYFSFAAYMAFGKALLDMDKQLPSLGKVIRIVMWVLILAGVGLLIFNFIDFRYKMQETAFIVSRLIILPWAVVMVGWVAWVIKSPIKWFFIMGSSLYLLGGILAVVVDPKTKHLFFEMSSMSPVYFFKLGILAEIFCFALALGYKLRVNQREKEAAVRSYINQLEVNRQLIATENVRLEKMVEDRTAEIVSKSEQLEIQSQERIRSDFERQIIELEMKALRAQINPHFIFNSLNSIRYQIQKKDYEKASDYLIRFAKLLRKILQSSRGDTVSLQEELEMVSLYLELECLRFNDDFAYEIIASPAIDLENIQIPPMLIQPFVENSIKHGLIHSEKPVKKLIVEISSTRGGFNIEIKDNGIGRSRAPSGRLKNSEGFGLAITNERITLFNQKYKNCLTATIDDLTDGGKPSGTLVTLFYKW